MATPIHARMTKGCSLLMLTNASQPLYLFLSHTYSKFFLILRPPNTHTQTPTNIHTDKCTHQYTHIFTHTQTQAHTHTHTHTHTVTYPTGNQILASVYHEVISYYVTKLVLMKCMGICEDNECISIFNIVYFKCFISN